MNLSGLKLDDLQMFITVADSASFTAAADHLQTNTSTLSRRLKKLEDNLGTRLFERTTRNQNITETGKLFYQHCLQTCEQFELLGEQIDGHKATLNGRISVYAPAELFRYLIKELLVDFSQQYPKLRIEFVSGGAKPHLTKDNIDIIVHIDEPSDSSLIAKKINSVTTNFYASAQYLAKRGEPAHPQDMMHHDCIVENNHDRIPRPWAFISNTNNKSETVNVYERFASDSSELCKALAEQGQGIVMLPDFIAKESLESGRLVKLFSNYHGASRNIYTIYASRQYLPRKIRAFIDFLTNHVPKEI